MADRNYGAIKSAEKFETFVDRLLKQGKPVGYDIESGYTGPDLEKGALLPFHPNWVLVGFSFTNSTDWARYVPIAHDSGDNVDDVPRTARALWRLLQSGLAVPHNATFELKATSRWFRDILWNDPDEEVREAVRASYGSFPVLSDTMVEAFLTQQYDPLRVGIGLKGLVLHIWNYQMVEFKSLFPLIESDLGPATKKAKMKYIRFNTRNVVPATVNYACEDSVFALALHEKHIANLKSNLVYRTEMELQPVIVKMEQEALLLNWVAIHAKAVELARFSVLASEEILAELSRRLERTIDINLASPQQLGKILFDVETGLGLPIKKRTDTGQASTDEAALRTIAKADPVVRKILEWKEIAKLYGSYLNKYDTQLNYAGNGRAYPNHNQTGAGTGRFSVDGVSYQQWPKPYHFELNDGTIFDFNFRDLLISPEDFRIIGYDFSQVELRVLAGMAQERALLQAFADNVDVHSATAAAMMKLPLSEITKKYRAKGKTMNFAVVFGSGPELIAEMLTSPDEPVTADDARELLRQYFAGFPDLRKWMDNKIAEGREQGYVETLFGRKYTVWEYQSSNDWIRSKGDRMCVNAPVQGGAADYMKIGMVRAARAIKKAEAAGLIPVGGIRLVMTIHDALEFYVHKSVTTQTVIDLISPAVTFPVKGLPVIKADWHEGYQWGSVVEINLDSEKKIESYELTIELHDRTEEHWEGKTLHEVLDPYYTWSAGYYGPVVGADYYSTKNPDFTVPESTFEKIPAPAKAPLIDPDLSDIPMVFDEDPVWAHNTEPKLVTVTLSEMPRWDQWTEFKNFVSAHRGADTLKVVVPDGVKTLGGTYGISMDHQPEVSLILGGALITVGPLHVDSELVLEGIEL